MTLPTFEDFAAAARSRGFTEVLTREWAAGQIVPTHTHPFAVTALVVAGEMWLTDGERTRHMVAGDRFDLDRDIPHAERYGPLGATYWVARAERMPPSR